MIWDYRHLHSACPSCPSNCFPIGDAELPCSQLATSRFCLKASAHFLLPPPPAPPSPCRQEEQKPHNKRPHATVTSWSSPSEGQKSCRHHLGVLRKGRTLLMSPPFYSDPFGCHRQSWFSTGSIYFSLAFLSLNRVPHHLFFYFSKIGGKLPRSKCRSHERDDQETI